MNRKASVKLNKLLCSLLALILTLTSVSAVAGETIRYVHTDHLGTPIAWTDENGNVVKTSEYEPYGLILNRAPDDSPGYTGHVEDAATGLTYMQQRYYEPGIGMFLSVDPVTAHSNPVGQFNRYRYANGNPYKFTDPDGRYIESAIDAASLAVGVTSLVENVSNGNYGAAAVDVAGLALDAVALALPVVPGGAGLGIKLVREGGDKAALFEANKAQGAAGEAKIVEQMGDQVAGTQVSFKTSDGTRTRTDIVTTDGGVVEVKTGNAKLSTGQAKLKADIDAGRPVTPVGKNAEKAGLVPGEARQMSSCTVERC